MRAETAATLDGDGFDRVSRRFAFATFGTGGSLVYVAYGVPVRAMLDGERAAKTRLAEFGLLVVDRLAEALDRHKTDGVHVRDGFQHAPIRDVRRRFEVLQAVVCERGLLAAVAH